MSNPLLLVVGLCAGYLLIDGGLLVALLWRGRRRPPMHYRVGYDATHPLPPVDPRPVPPGSPERAAHDATVAGIFGPEYRIVARPLGWDAQPREEY
jgi:hypothetical protein